MLNDILNMWINSHTYSVFSTLNQDQGGQGVWQIIGVQSIPHVKIPKFNVENINLVR